MVDALIASGDAALARADWPTAKADTLLFGLTPGPEGMSDIYISTR